VRARVRARRWQGLIASATIVGHKLDYSRDYYDCGDYTITATSTAFYHLLPPTCTAYYYCLLLPTTTTYCSCLLPTTDHGRRGNAQSARRRGSLRVLWLHTYYG